MMLLHMAGRQSSGPIAAFLRPLPPSQPEAEAKAQAASLAATAAAASKQQEVTLHGAVQVCLMPDGVVPEGRALPALDKPFLSCPAKMHVRELQKVQTCCALYTWFVQCMLVTVRLCSRIRKTCTNL